MTDRAEQAMKRNNLRKVYRLTRVLSQKESTPNGPVKNKTGVLLTNSNDQMARWQEYFNEILNQSISINPEHINIRNGNENVIDESISIEQPTANEVRIAIQSLKNGKAPGIDNIPVEVIKADIDIDIATAMMTSLIANIWKQGVIPDDWKKGLLIKIPKKGDVTNCKN